MIIESQWLEPTGFIDSESPAVRQFAERAAGGTSTPTETAIALFTEVRDSIRYDPYNSSRRPEDYRASTVATSASNWCVPKAVLLTAVARASGIPARLGFADVRNHLNSEKLREQMGTDLFLWHGYSELLLEGEWRKASPAFNIELCERFGVKTMDFNGVDDALFHPFDERGRRHMEYVNQRGSFDDLPLDEITATFEAEYPTWFNTDDDQPSNAADAGDDAFSPTDR